MRRLHHNRVSSVADRATEETPRALVHFEVDGGRLLLSQFGGLLMQALVGLNFASGFLT
jgi:hypothetical protein